MSEKLQGVSPELEKNAGELEKAGHEAKAEMEKRLEQNAEKSSSENLENARHEALELAQEKREKEVVEAEKQTEKEPTKPVKRDLDVSFNKTMRAIRKDMSPASRAFSKVIHNPVVEKTSDIVGGTVARPNLILAGAIGTLTLCLVVYIVAKHFGYPLSGFEAIGTFILGWSIGAIVEFARVGLKNKQRR